MTPTGKNVLFDLLMGKVSVPAPDASKSVINWLHQLPLQMKGRKNAMQNGVDDFVATAPIDTPEGAYMMKQPVGQLSEMILHENGLQALRDADVPSLFDAGLIGGAYGIPVAVGLGGLQGVKTGAQMVGENSFARGVAPFLGRAAGYGLAGLGGATFMAGMGASKVGGGMASEFVTRGNRLRHLMEHQYPRQGKFPNEE